MAWQGKALSRTGAQRTIHRGGYALHPPEVKIMKSTNKAGVTHIVVVRPEKDQVRAGPPISGNASFVFPFGHLIQSSYSHMYSRAGRLLFFMSLCRSSVKESQSHSYVLRWLTAMAPSAQLPVLKRPIFWTPNEMWLRNPKKIWLRALSRRSTQKGRLYAGNKPGRRAKMVQLVHDSSVGGHSGILGTRSKEVVLLAKTQGNCARACAGVCCL